MSEANAAPAADPAPATADAPTPASLGSALYPEGGSAPTPDPVVDEPIAPAAEAGEAGDSEPKVEEEEPKPGTVAAGDGSDLAPEPLKPEDYEFTLPEGMEADAEFEAAARAALAENKVPKEAAAPLMGLLKDALTAQQSRAQEAFAAQQREWLTQIDAMEEFKGPTRETSLASIGRLFDQYGTPEAREALNSYGIGNNPALARMFARVAAALDEGTPAPAGRPAPNGRDGKPAGKTLGSLLYPNTPQ